MSISIVHDDPVVDQCGYCDNGVQGDQYCRYCGGDGVSVFDLSALATLAHNIAWAASLAFATERVGSGRYCAFCDAPIPRESTAYCDHHGCLACGGGL